MLIERKGPRRAALFPPPGASPGRARGDAPHGDGVWGARGAGRTWKHTGLTATQQISALRVHPKDPDVAWVAAQGKVWGPSEERGIYRTKDGGKTWTGHRSLSHRNAWEHQRVWFAPQMSRLKDGRLVIIADLGHRTSHDNWPMLTQGHKPNRRCGNYCR